MPSTPITLVRVHLLSFSLFSVDIVVERSRALSAAATENPRTGNTAAATQAIRFLLASIIRRSSAVGQHHNGKQKRVTRDHSLTFDASLRFRPNAIPFYLYRYKNVGERVDLRLSTVDSLSLCRHSDAAARETETKDPWRTTTTTVPAYSNNGSSHTGVGRSIPCQSESIATGRSSSLAYPPFNLSAIVPAIYRRLLRYLSIGKARSSSRLALILRSPRITPNKSSSTTIRFSVSWTISPVGIPRSSQLQCTPCSSSPRRRCQLDIDVSFRSLPMQSGAFHRLLVTFDTHGLAACCLSLDGVGFLRR